MFWKRRAVNLPCQNTQQKKAQLRFAPVLAGPKAEAGSGAAPTDGRELVSTAQSFPAGTDACREVPVGAGVTLGAVAGPCRVHAAFLRVAGWAPTAAPPPFPLISIK